MGYFRIVGFDPSAKQEIPTMGSTGKRRIHENIWGNWYGYSGRRLVRAFMNSTTETQQQEAERWLKGDDTAGHDMATGLCTVEK